MALEIFQEQGFNRKSLALIERANLILEGYQADGYVLTIRQLYYQMVANNYIQNNMRSYKNFARLIANARLAGKVDWEAIEDRQRFLREVRNYQDHVQFFREMFPQYAHNLWEDQDVYCETWIEKDAVLGVVERPCNRYRVPYYSCKGYSSTSGMYFAGKRLEQKLEDGKRVVVLYLGDHDPSGLDITRDIEDRLNMFAGCIGQIHIERIALSMEQVRKYSLPPNFAKDTDSRAYDYKKQFGHSSWELDALKPEVLDALIDSEIVKLLDMPRFKVAQAIEDTESEKLQQLIVKWPTVSAWLDQIKRRENV